VTEICCVQGGDDTFASFPEKLRTVVGKALPAIDVTTTVYPKYETKGDLKECVGRFRDWYDSACLFLAVSLY
jgi:hypothetical protein